MSNVEKGFVPLTYAEQNGSERAAYVFELPEYVDKDKIGVNLSVIDRACRIGGIYVEMHGMSGMDTSSVEADVVGMNEKGEAVAGKTRVNKVNLSELQGIGVMHPLIPHQMRSTASHVHYNLDEMTERIKSRGDNSHGVRSASEWAREINTATKDTVSTLGQMQLLHLLTGPEKFIPAIVDAHVVLLDSGAHPIDLAIGDFNPSVPDDIGFTGAKLLLLNGMLNLVDYVKGRGLLGKENSKQLGFRLSLFNGPQFDRAMLLKAYAHFKTFFKELS